MIDWGYAAIMASAIATGFGLSRLTQRQLPMPAAQRLGIGFGAFVGAMLGAKFPFLFSDWKQFFDGSAWFSNGKTILTGLAGGYLGVEIAKWCMHQSSYGRHVCNTGRGGHCYWSAWMFLHRMLLRSADRYAVGCRL